VNSMRKRSITRRLIVSVVLTQLVLTAAVVALATYLTKWQLRTSFDAALHGRAMAVAALVRFSEEENPRLIFDSRLVPPPLDSEHADPYEIVGPDGHLIVKSEDWVADLIPPRSGDRAYWTAHAGHREFRVVRLRNIPVLDQEGPNTAGSTITVFYAASMERIRHHSWEVGILTCLGSLLLLGFATGATVWVVRRGLSPLAQLASSAGRVTAEDWTLHAPDDAHATMELAPLTKAMDDMLATLQKAFTSQREFVANAAHELKTPIAVLKSTLQLALQRPRTAEEYRSQLQDALDDVARLETLSHSMLRLARAEQLHTAKRRDSFPVVDLTASCEESADRWRPLAEAKSIRIQLQSSSAPKIRADPDDVELIWNNLLDNAIRYSPNGAEVLISISQDDGRARVEVRDSGPGISEADLRNIFERFHRGDTSRSRETGGYGLGLAIAKAMIEAYGGTIAAQSSEVTGTTFSVSLPFSS
jgi:signal transduction histidine kinase